MEFVVRARLGAFEPNADVFVDEEQRRVVAIVEVAGADPDSLSIVFDERSLLIGGRRRGPARLRHGSFVQKEIAYGDFVKRITLPVPVEYEQITASYEDGFLVVVAPLAPLAYLPTARTQLQILVKRTHS